MNSPIKTEVSSYLLLAPAAVLNIRVAIRRLEIVGTP
jgi:hypothetical protein